MSFAMGRKLACLLTFSLICLEAAPAAAQTVTGTITGTVMDASQATIPEAQVLLINEGTNETRSAVTPGSGDFQFSAVQPGVYTVKIQKAGFKTLDRTGINLSALERLVLGNMHLDIGAVTESINVTQQGETLDLQDANTIGTITTQQLDSMAVRGRDVMNMLKVLPGVSTIPFAFGGETNEGSAFSSTQANGGTVGSFTPALGGARQNWTTVSVDGQVASNADVPGLLNAIPVNMDGVAEVKVVTNDYTGEYGRNMGPTINVISRSGTKDFHGVASYFVRNTALNANDYFNNQAGSPRQVYKFNTFTAAAGGPIYIPGHFNTHRDKLFFYYSEEDWQVLSPTGFTRLTVPTALERQGDFSQTLDNGQPVVIKDPTTGLPFSGNIVPAGRIDPNGQALLNLLPLPKNLPASVTNGAFNFQWQESLKDPKRLWQLKLDYHPTNKDILTFTPRRIWSNLEGFSQTRAFRNVPLLKASHHYQGDGGLIAWTHIISNNAINEFGTGFTGEKELGTPTSANYFDPVNRQKVGFTLGQLFPAANPFDLIPQMYFGGVSDAPNVTNDGRLPKNTNYQRLHFLDNLSWTRGSHGLKFGFYFERSWATDGPASCCWNGVFDFSRDPNNPLDSNWAFSNALLGNFRSYQESNAKSNYRGAQNLAEWFAQDSWKATSRLTLTYGLRFGRFTPWRFNMGQGAVFVAAKYDASKISPLYIPAIDAGGNRVGQDPTTGAFVPAALIGAFVPGVGDPFNGTVLSSAPGNNNGFVGQRGVQVSPRFGFAYDVFGNAKTAVRGGFGTAKEATPSYSVYIGNASQTQPVVLSPQIFYSSMGQISQAGGVLYPGSGTNSFDPNAKVPSLYHYSLGVQQEMPWSTVLDVSYVGNVGRHLIQSVNPNTLPYGARFLPQNQDPTSPGNPLPDNFIRPYVGFGDLNYIENVGTSNYNALQVALNRRLVRGVQMGVAYTWSKALGYGSSDFGDQLPLYRPRHLWAYGPITSDQTHILVVNYVWDLPKASSVLPNPVVRHVLDNWQLSGIVSFSSGLPQSVSLGTTDNTDLTGGGDGVRPDVIAKVGLPHGDRTFDRWFNTSAFARPAQGSPGDASASPIRGPGVNNWDLTLSKAFPLWNEARQLEIRGEFYNAFNHTQGDKVDTFAQFDPAGNQTNGDFGHITSTRQPRIIQIAARIRF